MPRIHLLVLLIFVSMLLGQVGPERVRSHEAFPAALARVGKLLGVHRNHVFLHAARVARPERAQVARVRLAAGVGAGMPNQVALLGEGDSALGAPVRSLSRVRPFVNVEAALLREGLAASAAHEGLLPRMDSLVLDHAVPFVAGVRAEGAAVPAAALSVRHLPVSLQEVPGGEDTVAVPAREGVLRPYRGRLLLPCTWTEGR